MQYTAWTCLSKAKKAALIKGSIDSEAAQATTSPKTGHSYKESPEATTISGLKLIYSKFQARFTSRKKSTSHQGTKGITAALL